MRYTRIINYELKTAPTSEPITLAQAKNHLKVDVTTDDDLISGLIQSVRKKVESYTGRALIAQTWYGYADKVQGVIELTKCPVISVSSIKYTDTDGNEQTWPSTEYETDLSSTPARIIEADGYSYPTVQSGLKKWKIEFVTGYGQPDDVPEDIKSAMYLLFGHLYEHRESVLPVQMSELPMGVQYLLEPYIVWR